MFKIFAIEIGPLDGAVVCLRITHVGPVDVTGFDIHDDAVRKSSALTDNRLQVRAVWLTGEHAAGANVQDEQACRSCFCCYFGGF